MQCILHITVVIYYYWPFSLVYSKTSYVKAFPNNTSASELKRIQRHRLVKNSSTVLDLKYKVRGQFTQTAKLASYMQNNAAKITKKTTK